MMKPDIIESYVKKVYGYAVNNTYSREEADELAQEILFTAVKELPRLRDESRFEPWLWGIARNVSRNFRYKIGKQRAMYSYDVLENLPYEDEYFDEQEEIFDSLRTKIAMLSAVYREIIILYYYDGLSTKTISERLNVPEGTVRWRLSEARRKLKKECLEMQETALRPVKMWVDIYGSGNYNGKTIPFPSVYVNDALSQNILYYCYEEPLSIEELAKLCGVPAYYVEDRMNNLLKREAVKNVGKGKYQTDFIIWSDKHGIYCEENAEKALLPIIDELITALDRLSEEANNIKFYKAEKCENDLKYLYGAMAFTYIDKYYCNLPYPTIDKKYDGNRWCYIANAETGKHKRTRIATQYCNSRGTRNSFCHYSYSAINGIARKEMMFDSHVNACVDIIYDGTSQDIDSVAGAIEYGYIIKRSDGSLFVPIPAFTKEQKGEFDSLVEKYLAPLMPRYNEIIASFIQGYKKLFPKHVGDDVDRMCRFMFVGMYSAIVEYAQRTEKLLMPTENCYCDVLIEI